MSYSYTGVIFKIPFPFTDLTDSKARPAMALSEPDSYGDMAFAFITTKQSRGSEHTVDIPHGVLPFASHLHLDKVFLLNKEIILKEIVRVEATFLEQVLKRLTLMDTKRYYENTHHVFQQQPFVPGKSRVNYAGRVFDASEMCNLVDASLEFWLTYGRYSRQFEKRLAEFLGIKYAFLVNSGSSANLLAFMALTSPLLKDKAILRRDEVITMTMGEGGAVYTDNKLLKKILLSMRDWGRDCWCDSGVDNTCGCRFSKQHGALPFGYDHKYVYSHFGYNLKPTDLQAAIGCAQLEKLDQFTARRRENFQHLYDGLSDLDHIFHLPRATRGNCLKKRKVR